MPLRKKPPPHLAPAAAARRATEPDIRLHAPSYLPSSRRPTVDAQTGERVYSFDSETSTLVGDPRPYDVTEMMHSLTRELSDEDLHQAYLNDPNRGPGEPHVEKLPESLWESIAEYLSDADTACLALSSRMLQLKLARLNPWGKLNNLEKLRDRLEFLYRLDRHLPLHLLCTPCATFHVRIWLGNEKLRTDYVTNPLFICPKVKETRLPRTRLTYGRELPFSFVQLTTRHWKYGRLYGIPATTLDRRWKQQALGSYTITGAGAPSWEHASRYVVVKGHLLVRVTSTCTAPPGMMETERRLMLFEREDYAPYFSICAHWKAGDLVKICKCTLSHIPEAPERIRDQLKHGYSISISARSRDFAPKQCQFCKDVRRCPDCPTEYLIQIKMIEDKTPTGRPTFKHAIVVTRWSDLGNGSSPLLSSEWCAINGEDPEGVGKYDSIKNAGKRSISGAFEAETNNHLFLRRVINLHPDKANPKFKSNDWE